MKRMPTAAFGPDSFDSNFGLKDVDISPDTRLKLSFIDFENGEWSRPPPAEPRRLKALMAGAKDTILSELSLQEERYQKIGNKVVAARLKTPQPNP